MKPLSMSCVAWATAALVLCTSFTARKENALYGKHSAVEFATSYYWYFADDSYDGFMTTDQVIAQLEDSLHVIVNTNQYGGTFVAAGYDDNSFPHDDWAIVNLYSH